MAPFYKSLTESLKLPFDAKLYDTLKAANDDELKKLEQKIEDAHKLEGGTEVREALFQKAEFLARTGEKEKALAAYKETMAKTVGAGSRIDLVLAEIRLAFFHQDAPMLKEKVAQAKTLAEAGGDWERRNLLKIYEALYLLVVRDMEKAAKLLLDSIATFTCYDLMDYQTFIFYAVVTAVVAVDRPTLKAKVVKSPEVLSTIRDIPHLQQFLESFHRGKYRDFFTALVHISDTLRKDMYFAPHLGHYLREARAGTYKQFLQSYRSVKLSSMAESFGVTPDFLDGEISRFIASGRLNAKIDKVAGVVETNRPDTKNAQYQATIKQGDLLLTRMTKLTKIVSD